MLTSQTVKPVESLGLRIVRYAPEHNAAIERLNERFAAAGSSHRMHREREVSSRADKRPFERLFLAHRNGEVHGGAYLRESDVMVGGHSIRAGWVKYPISESLINKDMSAVPGALMFHLLREQPRLMAVGMGGRTGQFAQLLERLKWTSDVVPTFVLPVHTGRVLKELPHLQRSALRRAVAMTARMTGAAALASGILPLLTRARIARMTHGYRADLQAELAKDAVETIWRSADSLYAFCAVRDEYWLRHCYPRSAASVSRLLVTKADVPVGWAALQSLDLRAPGVDSPYGALRVGLILDVFAAPVHAAAVIAYATAALLDQDPDLLMLRHSHTEWRSAARQAGYLEAPPSFLFARSPTMQGLLSSARADDRVDQRSTAGPTFQPFSI